VSTDEVEFQPARTRKELEAELAATRRASRRINVALWGIAAGVMVFGAGYATELLLAHGAPPETAWVLSFMVDLGLCVALWADRPLARRGRRDGKLVMLRWTCAVMTWALAVAGALWPGDGRAVDWVGAGVRSVGPLLLIVVSEAAASVQRQMAEILDELSVAIADSGRPARKPAAVTPSRPAVTDQHAETITAPTAATITPPAPEQAVPAVTPTPARPAGQPDKDQTVAALVTRMRKDPDLDLTWHDVQSETGMSKSWCEKRLAEARREVRTPRLVKAAQ
jgi:hypothetical protein